MQLAFRVPPHLLDGCYRQLVERGAEIVHPPQVIDQRLWAPWQHRTLLFKDPDGNLLEIYCEIEMSAMSIRSSDSPTGH